MSDHSGSSIPIPGEIEQHEIACCHTHGLHGWKQPEGPRKWCYVCDGRVEQVKMIEVDDLPKLYAHWAEGRVLLVAEALARGRDHLVEGSGRPVVSDDELRRARAALGLGERT